MDRALTKTVTQIFPNVHGVFADLRGGFSPTLTKTKMQLL
jgi:hypothetical protein